eukprot:CAMPEP_0179316098 /NCGR_PEP_ID=MMETSP0797-20121207/55476_1 /TAXON_ID=47934 /ORGANISM="Dinophysis acuminata, Strain DAEP01" /LENGTH=34 /DNA_ID= /DNA_START= /DNA_END= /DNA_ORIENTATION=
MSSAEMPTAQAAVPAVLARPINSGIAERSRWRKD